MTVRQTIEIESVTIVTSHGTDVILINTTLPNSVWPFEGGTTLKVEAAAGTGEKWLHENFTEIAPDMVRVVNDRNTSHVK